jgi:hypothetical protein
MISLLRKPLSEIIGGLHQEVTQKLLGSINSTPFTSTTEISRRESLEVQYNTNWFSVTVDPVFDRGTFIGAVYILADITDRRRAEEALRFLVEASTVMSLTWQYRRLLIGVSSI